MIVDAQVHIWAADSAARPWPPGRAREAHKPYAVSKDDVLAAMNEAGVGRAVLVPPSWEGDRNDLALEAARSHPERFAVMGRIALEEPSSRSLLESWKQQPGMLGVRLTFHTERQRGWLTDGTADWLWPVAERHAIPIMIFTPGSLRRVGDVAQRHPALRLIIDHLGIPGDAQDAAAFTHLPRLLDLARHDNIAVKASALPCHSSEGYPYTGLHPYIRRVYDAFGPERMFWGTDWTRLPCPLSEAIRLFTEELDWLDAGDKEWIMGRGICKWLSWP